MKPTRHSLSLAIVTLFVVSLVPPSGRAWSDSPGAPDQAAQATALVDEIKALRKETDAARMSTAMHRLVVLHNALSERAVRHDLQHVAGQVLSDTKLGAERVAAAEALGQLDDLSGAYEHLKRSLPTPKTEAAGPSELAALRAVGTLAPDSAIPALFDLMKKGKDDNVSKEAVVALGSFGQSKKRVKVLEEVMDYMRRSRPVRTPGKRVGAATRARWSALGRSMVAALNELTGRTERSADAWLEAYKTSKRNPRELFLDEREGGR